MLVAKRRRRKTHACSLSPNIPRPCAVMSFRETSLATTELCDQYKSISRKKERKKSFTTFRIKARRKPLVTGNKPVLVSNETTFCIEYIGKIKKGSEILQRETTLNYEIGYNPFNFERKKLIKAKIETAKLKCYELCALLICELCKSLDI